MSQIITPGVRRRLVGVIFIVSSLVAAANVAYFTLMPIIAVNLSGSESAAGIPSTMGLLFRAVAAYPLGWLMGRAGRRLGLALGLLVGTFGMAVGAWAIGAGSFWIFSLGAGFAGVARGRPICRAMPRPKSARSIGGPKLSAGLSLPAQSGPWRGRCW